MAGGQGGSSGPRSWSSDGWGFVVGTGLWCGRGVRGGGMGDGGLGSSVSESFISSSVSSSLSRSSSGSVDG